MKHFVLFFFLALFGFGHAQIQFDKQAFNFGDLTNIDERFVDFELSNSGTKKAFVLRVEHSEDIKYIINKHTLEKDSSIFLRFQVNPNQKGRFSYEVVVYTSDRALPVTLKIKGNMLEVPEEESYLLTSCPQFGQVGAGANPLSFDLDIEFRDINSRELVEDVDLNVLLNGQIEKSIVKKGQYQREANPGFIYLRASHPSYKSAEQGFYVNIIKNKFVVYLTPEKNLVSEEPIATIEEPSMEEPVEEIQKTVFEHDFTLEDKTVATTTIDDDDEEKEENIVEPIEKNEKEVIASIPTFDELDSNNFDSKYFAPVNVVFVIDVSGSMRAGDKMPLMKYSLIELSKMLRSEDMMGLVAYATYAKVLLDPTSGNNDETIQSRVSTLKAYGATAGGEGIKLGFKQVMKNHMEDGVNHVVVITDGAFNRNSDDYIKYVKRYKKKGIKLSVVGINNQYHDREKMKEAAQNGGGVFIEIRSLSDAEHSLKQVFRSLAFKY